MAALYDRKTKDRLYKNVQFWISDLLQIYKESKKCNENDSESAVRRDIPEKIVDVTSLIKTVTVVGIVVGVRNEKNGPLTQNNLCSTDIKNPNRPTAYDIDDGTGVVTAVQFALKRITSQNSRFFPQAIEWLESSQENSTDKSTSSPESLALSSLISKTKKTVEKSRNSFDIGTCIEAKGCVQYFQGELQLLAFSVREITDPNQEMKRYIRLEHLKKQVYPKEFYT